MIDGDADGTSWGKLVRPWFAASSQPLQQSSDVAHITRKIDALCGSPEGVAEPGEINEAHHECMLTQGRSDEQKRRRRCAGVFGK